MKRINLLPPEERAELDVSIDFIASVGATLIILICFGFYTSKSLGLKDLKKQQAKQKQELNQWNRKLTALKAVGSGKGAKAARVDLVNKVVGNQAKWSDMFKELSLIIPRNTWLTKLEARANKQRFQYSLEGEADSQPSMAKFYQLLESSYYFKNLKLAYSEKLEEYQPEIYKFKFEDPSWKPVEVKKEEKKAKK